MNAATEKSRSRFDPEDPFALNSLLTTEERLIGESARNFAQSFLAPRIKDDWQNETCDRDLVGAMGAAGLFGVTADEADGGLGASYRAYGLVNREVERIDSSYRSILSVQSSLVIYPLCAFGSKSQKSAYLGDLLSGDLVGCFGLTEPEAGSDPASMRTVATPVPGGYRLDGEKTWITNAPLADVMIVWARSRAHEGRVRGFLLRRGLEGLSTPTIDGKMSLRASPTGSIVMRGVVVDEEAMFPLADGLAAPFSCLNRARFGIAWGAIGAAESCWHTARDYGLHRHQFGRPLAAHQLYQAKLADMQTEIALALASVFSVARMMDRDGKVPHEALSIIKHNSAEKALVIARTARDMLGANGIMADYGVCRHMLNLETVNTYEGTRDIHRLILGRAQTGLGAFQPT